jgi:uncharacterized protein
MSHSNAELIRRAYGAFAKGDVPGAIAAFADDIRWHVPGRSPLSGDYTGAKEVVGFFSRTMELSQGTFRIDIDDVLASGERVVVLCTVSAKRHGRPWSSPEVHVWRVANGRAVEFREFQGAEQIEDEFWSG